MVNSSKVKYLIYNKLATQLKTEIKLFLASAMTKPQWFRVITFITINLKHTTVLHDFFQEEQILWIKAILVKAK